MKIQTWEKNLVILWRQQKNRRLSESVVSWILNARNSSNLTHSIGKAHRQGLKIDQIAICVKQVAQLGGGCLLWKRVKTILNLAVKQALSTEETKKILTAAPTSIIGTNEMLRMTIVYKITKRNITNLKRTSKSLRKVFRANALVVQQQILWLEQGGQLLEWHSLMYNRWSQLQAKRVRFDREANLLCRL